MLTGGPTGVQVTWQAGKLIQTDYTVFVQALDQDDHVVAQVDSQPGNGAYPTSTWQSGDQIADTLPWGEAPPTWRRIVIQLLRRCWSTPAPQHGR